MFGLALIFLFLSCLNVVVGFSGVADGVVSGVAIALSFIFLIAAMISLSAKWKPRTTCFIYPTFSCRVP